MPVALKRQRQACAPRCFPAPRPFRDTPWLRPSPQSEMGDLDPKKRFARKPMPVAANAAFVQRAR